jgi:hypothetical protein
MSGARNIKAGLVLLALSLVGGLAMSLYAFVPMVRVPEGLLHYDDLPRRLLRLAHVAAVMVPLLNIVCGLLLDRLRLSRPLREAASVLLLAGAVGLPLALGAEALVPAAREWPLAGPPAVAVTLGGLLVTIGALRTPGHELVQRGPSI